jgi:hypothetical protein
VVAWFWDVVEGLSDAQRRMLLQFWSGSDGQPADGFGSLDPAFHMVRVCFWLCVCGAQCATCCAHESMKC